VRSSKQDLVGYALSLLEDPLRIQVLASQASSGAWVRNGYGLIQASSVYTTQVHAQSTHADRTHTHRPHTPLTESLANDRWRPRG
jgi:hypothetical protein